MYTSANDVFLHYDFNFLNIYLDVKTDEFVLSTQFIEFIQTKISIYKANEINYHRISKYMGHKTKEFKRIFQHFLAEYSHGYRFRSPFYYIEKHRHHIKNTKFSMLAYKVIILLEFLSEYYKYENLDKFL